MREWKSEWEKWKSRENEEERIFMSKCVEGRKEKEESKDGWRAKRMKKSEKMRLVRRDCASFLFPPFLLSLLILLSLLSLLIFLSYYNPSFNFKLQTRFPDCTITTKRSQYSKMRYSKETRERERERERERDLIFFTHFNSWSVFMYYFEYLKLTFRFTCLIWSRMEAE